MSPVKTELTRNINLSLKSLKFGIPIIFFSRKFELAHP